MVDDECRTGLREILMKLLLEIHSPWQANRRILIHEQALTHPGKGKRRLT